jgi:N-acyl-L-homoserine lactone synthetase
MSHGRQHGIEWLVFLVSPGLARLLERLGVPMEACGPEVEHRGTRRAYRAHIENGIASVPWMKCLHGGSTGYELFSTQVEGLAQAAA